MGAHDCDIYCDSEEGQVMAEQRKSNAEGEFRTLTGSPPQDPKDCGAPTDGGPESAAAPTEAHRDVPAPAVTATSTATRREVLHLMTGDGGWTACGMVRGRVFANATDDFSVVTCNACRRTTAFRRAQRGSPSQAGGGTDATGGVTSATHSVIANAEELRTAAPGPDARWVPWGPSEVTRTSDGAWFIRFNAKSPAERWGMRPAVQREAEVAGLASLLPPEALASHPLAEENRLLREAVDRLAIAGERHMYIVRPETFPGLFLAMCVGAQHGQYGETPADAALAALRGGDQ